MAYRGGGYVIRVEHDDVGYRAEVLQEILEDRRLRPTARALAAWLYSPEHERIVAAPEIQQRLGLGQVAYNSAMRELETTGYIVRSRRASFYEPTQAWHPTLTVFPHCAKPQPPAREPAPTYIYIHPAGAPPDPFIDPPPHWAGRQKDFSGYGR